MAINIPSLFRDVIETPEQRQRRKLSEAVALAPQARGGIASLLNPLAQAASINLQQGSEGLGRNVGGMLGLDMRDTSQKVSDELLGADLSSPQGMRDFAKTINRYAPAQAIGLLQAADEKERQKQEDDLTEMRIESERLGQNLTNLQISKAQQDNVTNIGSFSYSEGGETKFATGGIKNNKVVLWDGTNWIDAPKDAVELSQRSLSGTELSPASESLIQEYETAAIGANDELGKLTNFLQDARNVEITPGLKGSAQRAFRNFLGQQNEETEIIRRLNEIANRRAIEALPKGAASDTDIALVLKGEITADTANFEQIEAYINVARAIEAQNSVLNEEKSRYIQQNNSQRGLAQHMRNFVSRPSENVPSALEATMQQNFPYLYASENNQSNRSVEAERARQRLEPNSEEYLKAQVEEVAEFVRGNQRQPTINSQLPSTNTVDILRQFPNPLMERN
tara:strand:+ start:256 stop:1614 length:1359 start_codon:yes stop_codon:yes gene_type:complete